MGGITDSIRDLRSQGRIIAMGRPGFLPMQDLSNVVSLPLAYHDLKTVAQRDQPALTAHRTHLPHVVDVHDGVAVNPTKLSVAQPLPYGSQCFSGQEPLLCGYDPYQFPFGLECQNLIRVEKVILTSVPPDNLAIYDRRGRPGGGHDLGDLIRGL